jgi:hypothetical protein
MTTGAALLLVCFATALGYAAGRSDRRDLGPLRRRPHLRLVDPMRECGRPIWRAR